MKLRFWKRSNKSKAKGKRHQKATDACAQCESLRQNIEDLKSDLEKTTQQQQQLEEIYNSVQITKQEIAQIITTHQGVTEQSAREEQSQIECLKTAIYLLKNKHIHEVQELQRAREEVATSFDTYKAAIERARRDEQEEIKKLKAELAELKLQHQHEIQQFQLLTIQPHESRVWVLSLMPNKPAFCLVPSQVHSTPGLIQAPKRIGQVSHSSNGSAFRDYKKNHSIFVASRCEKALAYTPSRSPISPEDEEVASILSNVPLPGEYIRRQYGF